MNTFIIIALILLCIHFASKADAYKKEFEEAQEKLWEHGIE